MESSSKVQLLFQKYVQQQCTKDELNELIGLLKKEGSDEALLQQMQSLWQQQKEDNDYPVNWDAMYANLKSPVNSENANKIGKGKLKAMYASVAAAAIIILLAAGFLWQGKSDTQQPVKNIAQKTETQKATQPQTINLPDGSTVILNEGSTLAYPAAFTGKIREVSLVGEGYFDIQHNPKQVFIVHTGKLSTKVLGTAFNIKAYPGDKSIEVTVTRGKVQVTDGNKSVGVLVANQQITYNKESDVAEQRVVNTKATIAWKPDEIIFDDITMEEAADRIGQRFNMAVDFDNAALKNCKVSATFSEDDLMDEMLGVICGVTKATYAIKSNKIIIYGKGCN